MRSAAIDAATGRRAAGRPLVTARTLKGALGLVLFVLLWQASVPLVGLSSYFYPSPLDVWNAFVDLMRKGILPV